ncbi:hypothetical protein CHLNCDRAFT_141998 [Chlorella variabilis]|uniref:Uncharacterized protein n=1 Tax=Chlorella variabilis TaxID=554065 RepID=E1Z7I1_CHLVA|nr:hypothetical protein CHLNCDRAFT_141998 [Chlorella variabilis]EFN58173.1 hypothetical protein CHLNCDRAFT_141998 [Chlorella variabilis]|eukprot:XP_005850275.1 hypothetical protein CHLNCDRAFT_141998 [Chlorella variabilis]
MEAVELELLCWGDGVAVAIHLMLAGTPVKSFGSPLSRYGASSAASDDSSAGLPDCASSGAVREAAAALDAPQQGCFGGDGSDGAATPVAAKQQGVAEISPPASEAAATQEEAVAIPSSSGDIPGAAMEAVMSMLQQLLAGQGQESAQQDQAPAPAAPPPDTPGEPPSPRAAGVAVGVPGSGGGGAALPGGVEKLLCLELEVVQLQQSLQIAQLEFEARTVQLHSLKQRADDAEQRAQAAEERAAGLAQQAHALEQQAGDLQCQLGEAAARQQQLSARLAAAASKQQAAEEAAAGLRQQLAAAQQASEQAHAELRRAAAAQGEWQERAAAARHEGQQLKVHVAAACGALKALGIPVHKVFSRAALALAGHAVGGGIQSPPESPAEVSSALSPSASAQPLGRPPQVPRLQLSTISLEQLQQHVAAAQQQEQQQEEAAEQQQPEQQQTRSADLFAHVVAAADGAAAPGFPPPASPAETSASSPVPAPASCRRPPGLPPLATGGAGGAAAADLAPPLLTARRAVSPAQQELLAAAQQWQLTARSARSAAPAEEEALIPAYRPHQLSATGPPMSARHVPATACTARGGRHATPRLRPAGATSAAATPGGKAPRRTYGQDPCFLEIKEAYHAVVAGQAGQQASRWARSAFSSSSAVESEPGKVEPMVQGLLQLFRREGLRVPLRKCGPCQYQLGSAKLSVRLVSGRLRARAGAGQTMDVLEWLAKQPVQP